VFDSELAAMQLYSAGIALVSGQVASRAAGKLDRPPMKADKRR
jgi:hypothetical protein